MNKKNIIALILIVLFLSLALLFLVFKSENNNPNIGKNGSEIIPPVKPFEKIIKQKKNEILQFKSEEEFATYLENSPQNSNHYGSRRNLMMEDAMDFSEKSLNIESSPETGLAGGEPERFSGTNVQVQGIDEADVLKTNGKQAFYSPENYFHYYDEPIFFDERDDQVVSMREKVAPRPDYRNQKTTLALDVYPLDNLKVTSKIPQKGKLLLEENILTIISDDRKVYGYDISNANAPQEKWKIELNENSQLISSRLFDEKIYLVTFSSIKNRKYPCPIQPMKLNGQEISFACSDISYVAKPIEVDGTFEVMRIDPKNGTIEKKMAFAGSRRYGENLYMSPNALYISYEQEIDEFDLMLGFAKENVDIFPVEISKKLEKVSSYDISKEAKMVEFEKIMNDLISSGNNDENKKMENDLENRMVDYEKKHQRDFRKTGLVKIGAKNLKVEAMGEIPGTTLNQFSLDEYEGYLRVATTIGENFGSSAKNENDIYILDENLDITGQIQGLGIDERIYSARFVGDKGYLVTFKQTDPFFVFDLSNPNKPMKKGELKIPGYSSYLHPINSNLVLGIGEENNQVKISLFDVTDASNPFEKDKYILQEGWSEIANTHHAFLIDQRNKIFFLPGETGGYVFGYENEKLTLKKAIDEKKVNRALYINDYLYIFGAEKLVVLNEKNWERVKELEFIK